MIVELSNKEVVILKWLEDNKDDIRILGKAKVRSLIRYINSLREKGLIDYDKIRVMNDIKSRFGNVYCVFIEGLIIKQWKVMMVEGDKASIRILG